MIKISVSTQTSWWTNCPNQETLSSIDHANLPWVGLLQPAASWFPRGTRYTRPGIQTASYLHVTSTQPISKDRRRPPTRPPHPLRGKRPKINSTEQPAAARAGGPEVGGAFRAGTRPCSVHLHRWPRRAGSGSKRPHGQRRDGGAGGERSAARRPPPDPPTRPNPLPASEGAPGSPTPSPVPRLLTVSAQDREREQAGTCARGRDPSSNLTGQPLPHSGLSCCSAGASSAYASPAASGFSRVTWPRAGWRRARYSQAAARPPERGWR